jgi:hypothetical protein
LFFYRKWIINSRGYATIVQSERDFVYGLLFEMTRRDYELLDMFEGSAYVKQELRDSSSRRILTYIDPNTTPGLPDIKYIFRLYRGLGDAVIQGIPPDYFAKYLHPFLIGPGSSSTGSAVDDSSEQLNLSNED